MTPHFKNPSTLAFNLHQLTNEYGDQAVASCAAIRKCLKHFESQPRMLAFCLIQSSLFAANFIKSELAKRAVLGDEDVAARTLTDALHKLPIIGQIEKCEKIEINISTLLFKNVLGLSFSDIELLFDCINDILNGKNTDEDSLNGTTIMHDFSARFNELIGPLFEDENAAEHSSVVSDSSFFSRSVH